MQQPNVKVGIMSGTSISFSFAKDYTIDGKTVKLTAKAGAGGKLFGSVTAKEIAEGIEKQLGTALEKRKIVLKEDIKAFGSYTVEVKIYNGVAASVYVIVGEE